MNPHNNISSYKNYLTPSPGINVTVEQFAYAVISCLRYQPLIDEIRQSDTTESRRNEIKSKLLPCFTTSGTFTQRSNAGLIDHSGFVCLDIDGKHNPAIHDWSNVRDYLSGIEGIYFAALSVSGKGVFCLVPIAYPGRHIEHVKALEEDFKGIGITIDPKCKHVSCLRGFSHDPHAKVNTFAEPYTRIIEIAPEQKHNDSQTIDEDSSEQERAIHTVRCMIKGATDGHKHYTLLKAARLMGGFVAGKVISQDHATEVLQAAIRSKSNVASLDVADKTISDGITFGMKDSKKTLIRQI